MHVMSAINSLEVLKTSLGDQLQLDVNLAKYTSSRIGGNADAFVVVDSLEQLEALVSQLWELKAEFIITGGGSNMLVSDQGVRELVILNKSRAVSFREDGSHPSVYAESGANFGAIARQAAQKGLSGLEWAAGIPGTVGGAVVGNAGAHEKDVASCINLAEILHHTEGRRPWMPDELEFLYRSSYLKSAVGQAIVLAAEFELERSSSDSIEEKMASLLAQRRETQPPGASMGSMFKNPTGDYAGRLIDEAGLKGTQIGGAQISELHGNFFINHGDALADDVYKLLRLAQDKVSQEFGIELELEIELIGDWSHVENN